MNIDSSLFADKNYDTHYFASKRIVITGASGGIGRACCMWFLNQGARVILVGRDTNELFKIASEFPSQAICVQCDLTKETEHQYILNCVMENLDGLDILINAAGVLYENDLESTSSREHDYLMNVNLRAVFNICKLFSRILKKSSGCIVNLSSGWGLRPQQGMISYCMSKAGLNMLTKVLALELSPVRVNAIAPGMVNTKMLYKFFSTEEISNIKLAYQRKNPLHRAARVDEIIKTIVFLSSVKSSKLNGAVLSVDGGMSKTGSLFVDWDGTFNMNSKITPSSIVPFKRLTMWIDRHMERFKKPLSTGEKVKKFVGNSNWYTNLADAHCKITENYNKIEGEDNVLVDLVMKKDINGEIYTGENPKKARMMDGPEEQGSPVIPSKKRKESLVNKKKLINLS